MLIVFSGLPGSGKTTIARQLARQTGAVYLRIDVIEQALRDAAVLMGDVGASGYGVANALALSNLRLGQRVIADCVNPVRESRQAWQAVATTAGVELINIQVVCSDQQEHRRRVERRVWAMFPGWCRRPGSRCWCMSTNPGMNRRSGLIQRG
ncbi:putative kinase [Pseudomonas synxantha]|nr:putative kinase [Pseudomonas synxantha]